MCSGTAIARRKLSLLHVDSRRSVPSSPFLPLRRPSGEHSSPGTRRHSLRPNENQLHRTFVPPRRSRHSPARAAQEAQLPQAGGSNGV